MPTIAEEIAALTGAVTDLSDGVEAVRSQAQAWAESATAPGAAGTKSSKSWAGEAAASATAAGAAGAAAGASAAALLYRALPAAQRNLIDCYFPSLVTDFVREQVIRNGAAVGATDILSFSSGSKWVVGANGNYAKAAANGPAFDYSTGRKGLLIEAAAATNLLKYSHDYAQGLWSKSGGGTGSAPVVTPNYGVAPDGTTTATRVQFDAGAGASDSDWSILSQTVAGLISGNPYTGSLFVKGVAGTTLVFRHAGGGAYQIVALTGAWQRIAKTEIAAETSGSFDVGLRGTYSSGTTADVQVWHGQLEAGSFATSPIPTGASGIVRIADDVRLMPAALSLLQAPVSTIVLRGQALSAVSYYTIFGTNAGGVNLSAAGADWRLWSTDSHELVVTPPAPSLSFGLALASSASGGRAASMNSGPVAADAFAHYTGMTAMRLGAMVDGSYASSILIDEIAIAPIYALNASLQAAARAWQ